MPYNQFTLTQVLTDFNLTLNRSPILFADVEAIAPSQLLQQVLDSNVRLATAINTQKSRSELIIAPVLVEVWHKTEERSSLFSGTALDVEPERGLNGYCDYILSADPNLFAILAPIVTIVEAKKEDVIQGLGQCAATMVAAQMFNERAGSEVKMVYGAVTSGTVWRFLTLEKQILSVDLTEYFIDQVDKILGILLMPFNLL